MCVPTQGCLRAGKRTRQMDFKLGRLVWARNLACKPPSPPNPSLSSPALISFFTQQTQLVVSRQEERRGEVRSRSETSIPDSALLTPSGGRGGGPHLSTEYLIITPDI